MHPVVEQIREICEALPYRFADGISYRITRLVVGRPAIFIGDQPGQDKLLSKVTNGPGRKGCSVSWAPFDELDSTNMVPGSFGAHRYLYTDMTRISV